MLAGMLVLDTQISSISSLVYTEKNIVKMANHSSNRHANIQTRAKNRGCIAVSPWESERLFYFY